MGETSRLANIWGLAERVEVVSLPHGKPESRRVIVSATEKSAFEAPGDGVAPDSEQMVNDEDGGQNGQQVGRLAREPKPLL